MFLYYTISGRLWPGAALAARVEGGVVGEALADAVASAVGRRGAVGAAPASVARDVHICGPRPTGQLYINFMVDCVIVAAALVL